jgi:hypothetical protein
MQKIIIIKEYYVITLENVTIKEHCIDSIVTRIYFIKDTIIH